MLLEKLQFSKSKVENYMIKSQKIQLKIKNQQNQSLAKQEKKLKHPFSLAFEFNCQFTAFIFANSLSFFAESIEFLLYCRLAFFLLECQSFGCLNFNTTFPMLPSLIETNLPLILSDPLIKMLPSLVSKYSRKHEYIWWIVVLQSQLLINAASQRRVLTRVVIAKRSTSLLVGSNSTRETLQRHFVMYWKMSFLMIQFLWYFFKETGIDGSTETSNRYIFCLKIFSKETLFIGKFRFISY